MIRHTVVFRLRHERYSAAEKGFLDAAKALADIPGVRKFEQLKQVSPKNDYTFGFSMEFSDQAAYDGYNSHPDHVAFVRDRWVPEVEAFMEIDYVPLGRQPAQKPRQGLPGRTA
jgi:quinol monooxygenase YgiN